MALITEDISIADKPTLDEVLAMLKNSGYGLDMLSKLIANKKVDITLGATRIRPKYAVSTEFRLVNIFFKNTYRILYVMNAPIIYANTLKVRNWAKMTTVTGNYINGDNANLTAEEPIFNHFISLYDSKRAVYNFISPLMTTNEIVPNTNEDNVPYLIGATETNSNEYVIIGYMDFTIK